LVVPPEIWLAVYACTLDELEGGREKGKEGGEEEWQLVQGMHRRAAQELEVAMERMLSRLGVGVAMVSGREGGKEGGVEDGEEEWEEGEEEEEEEGEEEFGGLVVGDVPLLLNEYEEDEDEEEGRGEERKGGGLYGVRGRRGGREVGRVGWAGRVPVVSGRLLRGVFTSMGEEGRRREGKGEDDEEEEEHDDEEEEEEWEGEEEEAEEEEGEGEEEAWRLALAEERRAMQSTVSNLPLLGSEAILPSLPPSLPSSSSASVLRAWRKENLILPWGPLPEKWRGIGKIDPSVWVLGEGGEEEEEEGGEGHDVWLEEEDGEEEEEEGREEREFVLAGGLRSSSSSTLLLHEQRQQQQQQQEEGEEGEGERRGRGGGGVRHPSPSTSSFAAISAPFARRPDTVEQAGREGGREGGRERLPDLTAMVGASLEEQVKSEYGPMKFRSFFFRAQPSFLSPFTRGMMGREGGREGGREEGKEEGARAVLCDVLSVLDYHHGGGGMGGRRGAWTRGVERENEEEEKKEE